MRFYLLGLLLAGLEEFITQGVLKRTYRGWIIPTLIAFVPFLVLVRALGKLLDRTLSAPTAIVGYYLAAGSLGLAVEWFLIGLTPWRDPHAPILAMLFFQLGMFSFWGAIALVPRILLDTRTVASPIRRAVEAWLMFGFAVIYAVTFTTSGRVRFGAAIVAVLVTFLVLNWFYFQYFRALKSQGGASEECPLN